MPEANLAYTSNRVVKLHEFMYSSRLINVTATFRHVFSGGFDAARLKMSSGLETAIGEKWEMRICSLQVREFELTHVINMK